LCVVACRHWRTISCGNKLREWTATLCGDSGGSFLRSPALTLSAVRIHTCRMWSTTDECLQFPASLSSWPLESVPLQRCPYVVGGRCSNIATGYYLCFDRRWWQHSWGMTRSAIWRYSRYTFGRQLYFGTVLDDLRGLAFAESECDPRDITVWIGSPTANAIKRFCWTRCWSLPAAVGRNRNL